MATISMTDVLKLSVLERIRLVGAIWDSVAEIPEEVDVPDGLRAELDRRLEAYAADPDAGSPWAEVKSRLLGRPSPSPGQTRRVQDLAGQTEGGTLAYRPRRS